MVARHDAPPPAFKARSYVDTVVLHFKGKLPEELGTIKRALAGKGNDQRIQVDNAVSTGWQGQLLVFNQPTADELQRFGAYQREHGARLHRFDIAYDFHPRSKSTLPHLRAWFEESTVLSNRRDQLMEDYKTTLYWCSAKTGINLVLYDDALSKLTGGQCVHFDLRVRGFNAITRTRIKYADELLELNPAEHWARYIRLVNYDSEKFIDALVRMNQKIKVAFNSGQGFSDQYIRDQARDFGLQRAQNLKHFHPGDFDKLPIISNTMLGLPKTVRLGAVRRHRHHSKNLREDGSAGAGW